MIVICHHPDCGTSPNGVRIAEGAGAQLLGLFAAAIVTLKEALRVKNSPAEEHAPNAPARPRSYI